MIKLLPAEINLGDSDVRTAIAVLVIILLVVLIVNFWPRR